MGTLLNEFLYALNLPFMGMNKKVKVFVIESNATYETEFVFKTQEGKLEFYLGIENVHKNPKILSDEKGNIASGTKNASTKQLAYVWHRGEKFAFPLALRDTIARAEDEDAQAQMLIEHGKLVERGKWQKNDLGIDRTKQLMIAVLVIEIAIAVGIWQVLGALRSVGVA